MSFNSWLKDLRAFFDGKRSEVGHCRGRKRNALATKLWLKVEELEDRLTPIGTTTALTGTLLGGSPLPPSITYGTPVIFTAIVTPSSGTSNPTGIVDFVDVSDNHLDLGSVSGTAGPGNSETFRLPATGVNTLQVLQTGGGVHTISATYSPGPGFNGSTGTLGGGLVVTPAPLTIAGQGTGSWSTPSAMVDVRVRPSTTLLSNGQVLVAGGYSGTSSSTTQATAELYNPATDTWLAAASMATPRWLPGSTLLPNGKVLVVGGGGTNGSALSSAEIYDPVANTWSSAGNMTAGRWLPSTILLQNGKVLVAGGTFSTTAAELYDPATNTWSSAGSPGIALQGQRAVLLPSGQVLVTGGEGPNTQYVASCELYNPSTNTWTSAAPMANVRSEHSITLLQNGEVLVAGGFTGSFVGTAISSAELYNPATNTWSSAGSLAVARSRQSAALLPGGQVLVMGGENSTGALSSAELYFPSSNTWLSAPAMATSRDFLTSTLLPNGKVLVVGGNAGSNPGNSQLFSPGPPVPIADNKTYDSTVTATLNLNRLTLSGVYSGDAVSLSSTGTVGTFASKNVGNNITVTTSGFTISGTQAGNYTLVQPTATANIVPAALTITALPNTKTYDATTTAAVIPTVSGLLGNDTVTGLAEVYADRDAGSSKTLSVSAYTVHDGNRGANYSVTTALSTSGVIMPAPLTILVPPQTGWALTPSMATARQNPTETLLPNGQVLVTGGYGIGGILASAELYNPTTNTWSSAGSMAVARVFQTATLLANGLVLVAGGYNGSYLASAELYNPATNTWSPAGSMAAARSDHTATLLANGQVLIAGGTNSGGLNLSFLSSAELYNPATNSWSSAGSLMMPRESQTATLLANGQVLVTGGVGPYGDDYLASAELYNPTSNTWSSAGSMSTPRYLQSASLLQNGEVLVAGGYFNNSSNVLASAELYDPATNSWSSAGSMTTARYSHAATSLANGQVLVTGGYSVYPTILSSAELYDPTTNLWSPAGSMATPRESQVAALTADDEVLIVGGYNNSLGTLASAELYIAVSHFRANDKVYDSTTSATLNFSNLVLSGVYSGDTVNLGTAGAIGVFATKNVGNNITVTTSGFTISGPQAANYFLLQPTTSANINPAQLTITATPNMKTYDATTTAAASATVSGLVGGDSATGLAEVYANANAGTGKTLNVNTGYTVNDGNGGNNYTVTTLANTSGVINKAALTIAAVPNTKFYDGSASALAVPTVTGLQGGDQVTGLAEIYRDPNIGTGKTLSVSAYTVSDGNGGNNYTVTTASSTAGVILPPVTDVSIVNTQGSELEPPKGSSSNYVFTIRLAKALPQSVTANFSTVNGVGAAGARAGTDFKGATNATVTIPAGVTSVPINVFILGTAPQLSGGPTDKYFTVQLSWATNSINYAQNLVILSATGDIQQVFAPTVSIPSSQIVHLSGGRYAVAVNVTSTYPSLVYARADGTASVSYSTANGTAKSGTTFKGTSGVLTIPASALVSASSTVTIPITAIGAATGQYFSVTLGNASNTALVPGAATGQVFIYSPYIASSTLSGSPGGVILSAASQLGPIIQAAEANWETTGANPATFNNVQFQIGNGILANTAGRIITIDANADGIGWYINAGGSAFQPVPNSDCALFLATGFTGFCQSDFRGFSC